MDWFERLVGFKETTYQDTKDKLAFLDGELYSRVNHRRFSLGKFEICRLQDLRIRSNRLEFSVPSSQDKSRLIEKEIYEDAYALHCRHEANRAVVQVASQFNLLEMASPNVSPEDGVTRYQYDNTQGPACAMAAGPATLYRNFGVWVGSQQGQSRSTQVNTLDELIQFLDIQDIQMLNGYAMIGANGLKDLARKLKTASVEQLEQIKGFLKVGIHWDTAVTAVGAPDGQRVTQVFCSALPLAYNKERSEELWEPFARLILEACYEATLLITALNYEITDNPRVYLTRVGGGVFGNRPEWINDAITIALARVVDLPLQVIHVRR